MKNEIKGEVGKIMSELQGEISTRARVERDKGSQVNLNKKHKRFETLINEGKSSKGFELTQTTQFTQVVDKMMV